MKRLLLAPACLLAACSFAPIALNVPDFSIKATDSTDQVCYARMQESTPVGFKNVVYEGDALYTESDGLGGDGTITMRLYGREAIPGTQANDKVTCVTRSAADIALSDDITLTKDTSQRISAGGAALANLVTKDNYWLGASVQEGSLIRLPGDIDFSNGKVKANF